MKQKLLGTVALMAGLAMVQSIPAVAQNAGSKGAQSQSAPPPSQNNEQGKATQDVQPKANRAEPRSDSREKSTGQGREESQRGAAQNERQERREQGQRQEQKREGQANEKSQAQDKQRDGQANEKSREQDKQREGRANEKSQAQEKAGQSQQTPRDPNRGQAQSQPNQPGGDLDQHEPSGSADTVFRGAAFPGSPSV